MEEEQQEHRGFVITVSTQDHRAGGSTVTLLIERPLKDGDVHEAPHVLKPERYRSQHSGPAAVGEAMEIAVAFQAADGRTVFEYSNQGPGHRHYFQLDR